MAEECQVRVGIIGIDPERHTEAKEVGNFDRNADDNLIDRRTIPEIIPTAIDLKVAIGRTVKIVRAHRDTQIVRTK